MNWHQYHYIIKLKRRIPRSRPKSWTESLREVAQKYHPQYIYTYFNLLMEIDQRAKEEMRYFNEIKMSSKHTITTKSAFWLQSNWSRLGCGTDSNCIGKDEWIEIILDKECHVNSVIVGALDRFGWGISYINGAALQFYDGRNERWETLSRIELEDVSCKQKVNVNRSSKRLRLCKEGGDNLGVGCFKLSLRSS